MLQKVYTQYELMSIGGMKSEGTVQGGWSGVDQFSSFVSQQNLQVDENLGYGQKHVAVRHLADDISDDFIERSCPIVERCPDKFHPLPVVPLVGGNQSWHVSDVFPVTCKHVLCV